MTSEPVTMDSSRAAGLSAFAGTIMVLAGTFQFIQGLVALLTDSFYLTGRTRAFQIDVTAWGWAHLLVGVTIAVAGIFVFRGAVWARAVGVVLAAVSAVANFAWLPSYPAWAILIIALDLAVIWALVLHGRDIAET